jgi:NAD(P)H-dependent flavin oxidoreductase YrpB (nitropropane dioxygenase family)
MQWIGLPKLVAAVSNAGGLGCLTSLTAGSPEKLRESSTFPLRFALHFLLSFMSDNHASKFTVKEVKRMIIGNKPFAVNVTFLPSIAPPPYDEYAQVIISEGIKVVETAGQVHSRTLEDPNFALWLN